MFSSAKNWLRQLLVRSQKYTGTDNIYITKNGFWVSFPFIVGTALSAAQVLAFANFLPKEAYGTYKFILSATSIFGFLTLTGMNTAVTQLTAKGQDGALAWSVRLQLKFNAIYALAAIVLAAYYAIHHNLTIACGIFIIGLSFPLSAALNTYGAYLGGKKDFRRGAQYGVISNIFSSFSILGAILLTHNVIVIIMAYALGSLLPALYFYHRTARSVHAPPLTTDQKQELTSYGGHLSFINILSTIGQYLDKLLLFHSGGAVQLAVYSLAQAIPNRTEGYFKSWSSILLPKLSERSTEHIRPVFYKRVSQGLLIGLVAAAAYWIVAPLIFHTLLPKYLESLSFSRVIMMSFIFTLPAVYTSSIFRSQRNISVIYMSSIFGNVCLIACYGVFGTIWGTWGLVWGQFLAQMLGLGFNCFLWEWKFASAQERL